MTSEAAPIVVGFLVAAAITPLMRWLSHRHDLLDHPNERSSHEHPTPRNGGVAIIAGVVVALLVFGEWRDLRMAGVLVWASTIAILGLIDDTRSISAKVKLAVQVGAAIAVVVAADVTLRFVELPLSGDLRLPFGLGVFATLFWIVGLTNAFNFMDGVNGMAAIEAVVCAGAYVALFAGQGDEAGVILGLALAGGSLGFLVYNASGSIFMGDVGSGTLGFLFAVLALRLTYWDVPFFATVLPLLPFLFDTAVTLVKRAVKRERLLSAHRSHYYQKMTDLGWSHLSVSALYGCLAAICSIVAVKWKYFTPATLVIAVLVLVSVIAIGAFVIDYLHRRRQA